jgi:hypothetical protein
MMVRAISQIFGSTTFKRQARHEKKNDTNPVHEWCEKNYLELLYFPQCHIDTTECTTFEFALYYW